ncbi:MAG: hypothetical protein WD036_09260 [Bauldia sp.]
MDAMTLTLARRFDAVARSAKCESEDAYYQRNAPTNRGLVRAISGVAAVGFMVVAAFGAWPA